jgi:hypothetical protein
MGRNHKIVPKEIGTSIPSPRELPSEKIIFSFKHFQDDHPTCKKENFHIFYPKELLKKLKEFEDWFVDKFKTTINDQHYRIHPIRWHETDYAGFGLNTEYDANAWQFSVSKDAFGRVQGFFIDNIFHVVWLDPKHKVYKRKH